MHILLRKVNVVFCEGFDVLFRREVFRVERLNTDWLGVGREEGREEGRGWVVEEEG